MVNFSIFICYLCFHELLNMQLLTKMYNIVQVLKSIFHENWLIKIINVHSDTFDKSIQFRFSFEIADWHKILWNSIYENSFRRNLYRAFISYNKRQLTMKLKSILGDNRVRYNCLLYNKIHRRV